MAAIRDSGMEMQVMMDSMSRLLKTMEGYDSIWVVVDRLTKSTHFLPVSITYMLNKLVEIYIEEIVRLHGISTSIVFDRDSRFTISFEN